jgi:hypothetical protein
MSRCRKDSAGKSVLFLLLLLSGVLLFAALPDLQRYLRIRAM